MKTAILSVLVFLFLSPEITGQTPASQAFLGEDGRVLTRELLLEPADLTLQPRNGGYGQEDSWPIRVPAHPNFKSFRGVTLADMDGDGVEEILVSAFNRLHVFKGSGELLWSFTLTGTATYPPSVADVTGDGHPEVVVFTGGIPNNGRVYLFDATGNVMPGYPLSYNNQWILSAPVVADLDGDGQMEIIFGIRTVNELHVIKADGTPLNENWPVTLSAIPAFTPSVGDLDGNGQLEIIASGSNGMLYAFDLDGQDKPGFPVQAASTGFSYQSPLLVDFDGDGTLDIVGATHGNAPEYYVRKYDGTYRTGWPVAVPGGGWTYHPPTVVDINEDGHFEIFTAKPVSDTPAPMLFGFDPGGEMLEHFPITKAGGLEGFITVADLDGDGELELIFGSNMMVEGQGFIHAWKTDGSGQLDGFPLRPDGFTFMNGANLGDVTGDGLLNLVALSYEQTFQVTDSTVINVYHTGIPMADARVRFATYKGSNARTGLVLPHEEPEPRYITAVQEFDLLSVPLGTPLDELDLPALVQVELDGDPEDTASLAVNWEPAEPFYDGDVPGIYPFIGHLVLSGHIENPDELTASIEVEVLEADDWSYIRLVNAGSQMPHIHVHLNGEPWLADFHRGMSSDTLHLKMHQAHQLDLVDAEHEEVLATFGFELEAENDQGNPLFDEEVGMLIIVAGSPQGGDGDMHPLDFFPYLLFTEPTDSGAFLVVLFDAFARTDVETSYEITTLAEDDFWWGPDETEIGFGELSGMLFHSPAEFNVDIHAATGEESQSYHNEHLLSEHYGWGDPNLFMIILDYMPGESPVAGGFPHFLLLPPQGGMLIAPSVELDETQVPDISPATFLEKLYPNPAGGPVTLVVHPDRAGELQLRMVDVTGRTVYVSYHECHTAERREVVLDLEAMSPGFYLLTGQLNDQRFQAPLIIRR